MEPEPRSKEDIENLINDAWGARMCGRPSVLSAVYPGKTMAVSVTGKTCALKCSHCSGRYLERMVDLKDLDRAIAEKRPESILLSGGCDLSGAVPLLSGLRRLKELAGPESLQGRRPKINVHPGIAPTGVAREIGETADVVSFDVVLDDDTINQAFHGAWTGQDCIDTFRSLRKGKAEVVPHVLIGLRKGRIAKELQAVEFLLKEGVKRLIFIILIPTGGTPWADVSPPPVKGVAEVIAWTRARAPALDISLGCMRPAGRYRREVDTVAVRCGVDRIVLPHPDALRLATSLGLTVVRKEECCAFA